MLLVGIASPSAAPLRSSCPQAKAAAQAAAAAFASAAAAPAPAEKQVAVKVVKPVKVCKGLRRGAGLWTG